MKDDTEESLRALHKVADAFPPAQRDEYRRLASLALTLLEISGCKTTSEAMEWLRVNQFKHGDTKDNGSN